jgi:hypothetical protein
MTVSVPPPRITAMRFAAPRDSDDLMGVMDVQVSVIHSASAELLRAVAGFDRSKSWMRDGATSMTSWLAARYGLGRGTAREWVRVAKALRRLPRIAEAYRRGELSWDQLRPLTRFVTPDTEEYWAHRAPSLRPAGLWREVERHQRKDLVEANDWHRQRYLSLWKDPELPVVYVEGRFGAEQGAAVQRALEERAQEVVLADDPADPGEARTADALVELCTGGASEQGPRPTVVVHADARALTGEVPEGSPLLSETEEGVGLPTESVLRLACDSRIEWALHRGSSVVGIGRRGRSVPDQLLRVLRHRDQGACRFPGCERQRWLHAHHLVHWADGGGTNLDNLVLLCHAHHRLLHEGGWRTTGHPARDLRFHDPTGRRLGRVAPPSRDDYPRLAARAP